MTPYRILKLRSGDDIITRIKGKDREHEEDNPHAEPSLPQSPINRAAQCWSGGVHPNMNVTKDKNDTQNKFGIVCHVDYSTHQAKVAWITDIHSFYTQPRPDLSKLTLDDKPEDLSATESKLLIKKFDIISAPK